MGRGSFVFWEHTRLRCFFFHFTVLQFTEFVSSAQLLVLALSQESSTNLLQNTTIITFQPPLCFTIKITLISRIQHSDDMIITIDCCINNSRPKPSHLIHKRGTQKLKTFSLSIYLDTGRNSTINNVNRWFCMNVKLNLMCPEYIEQQREAGRIGR